jgi:hypothetical protein
METMYLINNFKGQLFFLKNFEGLVGKKLGGKWGNNREMQLGGYGSRTFWSLFSGDLM